MARQGRGTTDQFSSLAVVALGGNALLKRGELFTLDNQIQNAQTAAQALAELAQAEHLQLFVTHGNGPQVGLLAEQDPLAPLDVLGAETQGQICYTLELQLANQMPQQQLAAVLTQTVVNADDPAFRTPSKPVGRFLSDAKEVQALEAKKFSIAIDPKHGWRRVVASPKPVKIVEAHAICTLLDNKVLVICCGGGGIPVVEQGGRRCGVEAVIDKDLAAALLAKNIGAGMLLLLTDADAIFDPRTWSPKQELLPSPIKVADIEQLEFVKGSMAPKVAAVIDFVRSTGKFAGVGNLHDAVDIVRGIKGTWVTP